MEEYISKSALVAEIKRRIKEIEEIGTYLSPKGVLTNLLCYLNILEVKEVDLEKEYERYYEQERNIQTFKLAKHFFELGLKAQKEIENEDLIDLHKTCEWVRKNYGEEAVFNFCKAMDEQTMTQEELIKFLKDNLRIEVDSNDCWETKELCIRLCLGDEILSCECVSI